MYKIIALAAGVALMAAPAQAKNGNNAGLLIGGLATGLIVGSIIANESNREERHRRHHHRSHHVGHEPGIWIAPECRHYYTEGERIACTNGVITREEEEQARRESEAFRRAYRSR